MFSYAFIPKGFDISQWDTGNVENMERMFNRATIPEGFDLRTWNVKHIKRPSDFGDFSGDNQHAPLWAKRL